MISLPVAFLSLVPSGTVGPGAYDLIEIVTALFPFDPALRALSSALESGGPSLLAAVGHLAALTLAYGALARLALRRLA
jgi:ABC-2 type transport system permease protein